MSVPFARVIECRGPRAAERALLDEVERLRPRLPDELARPLRIIVPSTSLRLHLLGRLVGGSRGAVVGVTVQTVTSAAREVLDRAGEACTIGDGLTEILVRRAAGRDRLLSRELDGLEDGYGAVVGAVRDLLDAGFGPAHLEALGDKLESLASVVSARRLERVIALARVAVNVAAELDGLGVRRVQQLPQRATELLRGIGATLLPTRAVLVHGFADATGVVSDFLEALLAVHGGAALLDRPPDPSAPDEIDAGAVFVERLASRLGGLERASVDDGVPPPELVMLPVSDPAAEVCEVAQRILGLLDAGAVPESIAVVARDLEPVLPTIRRSFDRLGVPYSGVGAEVAGGERWRRCRQLARLLRAGADLPAEQWVESLAGDLGTADLQLALRTLGVVRLGEVAALEEPREIRLPLAAVASDDEPPAPRRLPASILEDAVARARRLERRLATWPQTADAVAHRALVEDVVEALGWGAEERALEPLRTTLERLTGELPEGCALAREEWMDEASRRLESAGGVPLGGAGGGVQVLSALEARSRTFEELFLIRLNRGIFPRVFQDDPLLPDPVRGHLAVELLSEFPVKARGQDEERYLFAQLVAAAPRVMLSWSEVVDESTAAPSPFVVRLARGRSAGADAAEPSVAATTTSSRDAVRPAFERAVELAEQTTRQRLAPVLATARAEGRRRAGLAAAADDDWARARIAVLDAIEPPLSAADPGPWAGMIGPDAWTEESPAVTRIEELARCPWQALAVRRLGMSPMPDPRSGLPDPGPAVVGQLVHRVLQRIVDEELGRGEISLEEARRTEPLPVDWPDDDRLDVMLRDEADRIASAAGLSGFRLAPLLAAQTRPYLDEARDADWGPERRLAAVLAAEVSGEVEIDGLRGPLRFRADRADRGGDGLELVDYKIGAPPSTDAGEETRHGKHLERIATGRSLQAVAYAAAGGAGAVGRYLHLKPGIRGPDAARSVAVTAGDGPAVAAFGEAVAAVAAAVEAGAFFPRVEEVEGGDPRYCEWCPVRQACLRDDSGYRRRLVEWMGARDRRRARWATAARRLWWLGVERPEDGS